MSLLFFSFKSINSLKSINKQCSILKYYANKPRKTKKTRVKVEKPPGLKKFLLSKPCLKAVANFIPQRFLKVKKDPSSYSFVADDEVAANIVDKIKKHIAGDTPLVEANPGLGLLTRHLLKAGISKILIFEPLCNLLPPLQQLLTDNPDKISVIPSNFFEVYKVLSQDKIDNGDRFNTLFKDVPVKKWSEAPALKVIGVVTTSDYLRFMVKSIALTESIIGIGRIENILIISDKIYKDVTLPIGHLRNYILFNKFFDLELLGELPRSAFLPWDKGKLISDISKRVMLLVRVIPKSDIFDNYSAEELKTMWFFIIGLSRSKDSNIVAFFEKWFPSSGLALIREGISPITPIGHLSVQEVAQLFDIFTTLPDFDETTFMHIQESWLVAENASDESREKKKSHYWK